MEKGGASERERVCVCVRERVSERGCMCVRARDARLEVADRQTERQQLDREGDRQAQM
jgi:hypothetical protein